MKWEPPETKTERQIRQCQKPIPLKTLPLPIEVFDMEIENEVERLKEAQK